MELHLEEIQIRESGSGGIYIDGCLFVLINDTYFPSYQWFDLISVDFGNWVPCLISFAKGHTDFCALMFMDGPYQIKFTRVSDGTITAVCLEHATERIVAERIDFSAFLCSAAKCLNQLGTAIFRYDHQLKYKSEIARLGAVSRELRNLIPD